MIVSIKFDNIWIFTINGKSVSWGELGISDSIMELTPDEFSHIKPVFLKVYNYITKYESILHDLGCYGKLEPSTYTSDDVRFLLNIPKELEGIIDLDVISTLKSFLKSLEEADRKKEERRIKNEAKLKKLDVVGYIYLAKDLTHSYTKIGWSIQPKIRERTLQAEKPTLYIYKKFVTKQYNDSKLKHLFNEEGKRVRGEWYNLDDLDIERIEEILGNEK